MGVAESLRVCRVSTWIRSRALPNTCENHNETLSFLWRRGVQCKTRTLVAHFTSYVQSDLKKMDLFSPIALFTGKIFHCSKLGALKGTTAEN